MLRIAAAAVAAPKPAVDGVRRVGFSVVPLYWLFASVMDVGLLNVAVLLIASTASSWTPRCRSSTADVGSSKTARGCCEAREEARMSAVTVVGLNDVEPIELPGGSWSRMVLNERSLEGNAASLGYS